ncbi:baseplate J/gp47 family protein [Halosegnis longus]|uniref:baseplate J/gp47 family protein n=1 Tax=Halosegnis longus TaxID=2216012 RepID=UPI00129EBBA6|nr:baseplate J/gp47 family protein [Halosegnis longus]
MSLFTPRSVQQIKAEYEDDLTSRIDRLTDFDDASFDASWIEAHARQVHKTEVRALAVQLSGFVDYAGYSDFTEAQLEDLGITTVDPEQLNDLMDDQALDELAKTVSVTREPGTKATGTVTFEVTSDEATIPEGYEIGTQPDPVTGEYLSFYVDADGDGEISPDSEAGVTPGSGNDTVTVDVIAAEIGATYNVGAGAVSYLPAPVPGVRRTEDSSNMTGGTDIQSNESLREDIKGAVPQSTGGGTRAGIIGYIESGADENVDVKTDEFTDSAPSYVDVVVNGGDTELIKELIDESHSLGVRHNLVRPIGIRLGVMVDVVGRGTDTADLELTTIDYIDDLDLGGTFSQSTYTGELLRAGPNITSVPTTTTYITNVETESFTHTSGETYTPEFAPFGVVNGEEHQYSSSKTTYKTFFDELNAASVTVSAIVDDSRVTLSGGGTDFTVEDTDGDGANDAIVLTGTTDPDPGTLLTIDYEHTDFGVVSLSDGSQTYEAGTDFDLVDTNGDGLAETLDFSQYSTIDDGTELTLKYAANRTFLGDFRASVRQVFRPDADNINVSTGVNNGN